MLWAFFSRLIAVSIVNHLRFSLRFLLSVSFLFACVCKRSEPLLLAAVHKLHCYSSQSTKQHLQKNQGHRPRFNETHA